MKQENDVVLADMLLCAAGWHVDACLIGNVTAGQVRAFCLSVSDYKARIADLETDAKLNESIIANQHKLMISAERRGHSKAQQRIERLEECLRMCVPYLPEATATKDEVMEVLGGDA